MTETLRRREAGGAAEGGGPSAVVHAVLAGLVAALSGLAVLAAVVLVTWVADAAVGSSGGDAVRAAGFAWLLGHGGGLSVPGGHVSAVPLGVTAIAAVLLHRAGASVGRAAEPADLTAAAKATGALTGAYALTALVVALLTGTGTLSSSAWRAGLGAARLAAVAGGCGLVRAANLTGAVKDALPDPVPAIARGAALAVAALAAAGALLVVTAELAHAGRFGRLFAVLDPGLVGGAVLTLACVVLLPNVALWGVAYAAGPGFAVGAGTGVSPFGATLGPVPAFPLLAALPEGGTPPAWVRAALVLPVLAGVLAGFVVARRLPAGGSTAHRALHAAGWAALAGVAAALALTLLAAGSGGSLGPGYLAAVGPSPWRVLLALTVELAAPAALTAAVLPTPADRAEISADPDGDSRRTPAS